MFDPTRTRSVSEEASARRVLRRGCGTIRAWNFVVESICTRTHCQKADTLGAFPVKVAPFSATLNYTSIYFIITCGKSGRFFGHSKLHKSLDNNYLDQSGRFPAATFWPILNASSCPISFSDARKNGRLRAATVRLVSARAYSSVTQGSVTQGSVTQGSVNQGSVIRMIHSLVL